MNEGVNTCNGTDIQINNKRTYENGENGGNGGNERNVWTQNINDGEEDEMEVIGYEKCCKRTSMTFVGYLLSLGILRLIFHWYPRWKLMCTHKKCTLDRAKKVLITHDYQRKFKTYFVKDIKTITIDNSLKIETGSIVNGDRKLVFRLEDGRQKESVSIRAFWVKKLCYIWNDENRKFMKLIGFDRGVKNKEFHNFVGFSNIEQKIRKITYGSNEIEVPVQSILTLLVLEALNPFYIFQVFTLAVWLAEYYYYYTIAIIIMSVFGISSSIIQTRKNQMNLKGTVHSMEKARVLRADGNFQDIPSTDLIPGDVLLIPTHGCTMHCDAVLLEGNCIVNESMLTGESVPVTKTPLPKNNIEYNLKEDANHTLFCGTKVIQTRFYGSENVRAVVIRTGYLTTKGQLVRSILYPPPADFKFDQDSYRFIGILGFIAFLGFLYTVVSKVSRGIDAADILIKALDIITIVVPPALPAAMTVGKLYAINRLKKNRIFCMNSRVINVTGSINCVCFDKTGTLTEDGLDMWGVVPVIDKKLHPPLKNVKNLPQDSPLLFGMSTCHSLTIVDRQLCGDPLDVKMFESTGWILEEPDVDDTAKYDLLVPTLVRKKAEKEDQKEMELGIIKQYQFSSTLQRMSVVTKSLLEDNFRLFCKGSPEMIINLSLPETVPADIFETLKFYTEQGYRVIAIGSRVVELNYLKIMKTPREKVEKDLIFVGLIILENQLKPQTNGVIKILKEADIKTVMITGDNIQTAVSVARECGIIEPGKMVVEIQVKNLETGAKIEFIETGITSTIGKLNSISYDQKFDIEKKINGIDFHLTMTGNSWAVVKEYFPDLIPRIVAKGAVFARMSGDQKQQLILELQNLGYYVAMCGDGANDCGALKAAHTGISLSEAESSVASPFTSNDPDISCVPKVIREGRAALTTSFGVFKFMVAYSLTEFLSVIILYGIDSNLTNIQFLFIDICLVVNFASFFGKTEAYKGKLVRHPPMTSLLGFTPLMSLLTFMIVTIFFQYFAYYFIQNYDWFVPFAYNEDTPLYFTSYENYAVYSISLFQYITMVIVFSKGRPYRMPIYTNLTLIFSILIMIAVNAYIVLSPAKWIIDVLELKLPPSMDVRVSIIGFAFVNFVLCLFLEYFLVEFLLHDKVRPMFHNVEKSRKKYLRVLRDIGEENWPRNCKEICRENGINFINEKCGCSSTENIITKL